MDQLLKQLKEPSVQIGSYDPSSPEQEAHIFLELIRKRNELADKKTGANKKDSIVYVFAYAKQGDKAGEAGRIADGVRARLSAKYKIDPNKIFTVDGGYQQNAVVELFIQRYVPSPPAANAKTTPKK